MAARSVSAGDFDYDRHGAGYAQMRRPDPRIAALVHAALGDAISVVNVGAGAGSYEPTDRDVTAVEPSEVMRAQRPAHLSRALDGIAEDLPFGDDTFDAAMATITVHQWRDLQRGLEEMRRVAHGPVVILTFDPAVLDHFWLNHYIPEIIAAERPRYPVIERIGGLLGGHSTVAPVPVPIDCVDGFGEAFYGRPEALLDPAVRAAQSGWAFVDPPTIDRFVDHLRSDLDSGEWDRQFGHLRSQAEYVGSLRLLTAFP
jgi:SAM-dependent methyltransferase